MAQLEPRCVKAHEAAAYCGVSVNLFKKHGPGPIRMGKRCLYDKSALDMWLDKQSGITSASSEIDQDRAELDRVFTLGNA